MFERGLPAGALAAAQRQLDHAGAGGVLPGGIVAWLGWNCWQMLALLAACEARGAVLLPLNWRLATAELQRLVEHAGAGWLLHDEACAEAAAALRAAARFTPAPAEGVEPGDLLLVYTSGTTGEPKGAMHTAAAMAANARMAIEAQGFDAETRVLAVLPLFHVGGLCIQVLPVLQAGGALKLHARFDATAWFDDVAAWRPTTSLLVPAVMRALVEHPRWAAADLGSLRFVTAGSQIVPRALIEAFHARGVPVAQVYGATETGPVSLVIQPAEAMAQAGRSGRPAAGVEVRLASDGEIRLRAPNLMRGYHRHGAPSFDAEGFFATGDLAQQHDDGSYEVVGRSKELIISGGENIHPLEIENLLVGWPGIAEAAVVGVPDARWGEVPVLAVVLQGGAALDGAAEAALARHFEQHLARFKHPRHINVVAGLPKTALGKVQRAELARLIGPRARG